MWTPPPHNGPPRRESVVQAVAPSPAAPLTVPAERAAPAIAPPAGVSQDDWRTARLLFAPELRSGAVSERDLDRPEVLEAARVARVPSLPVRVGQRVLRKLGRLDWTEHGLRPVQEARRAVLGAAAEGPPRLLVRMDEFPHYETVDHPQTFGTERYRVFHDILTEAGVPYLIAVVARPARAPLDPQATGDRPLDDGELAMLAQAKADGAAFAVHGLTHRTRHAHSRRHSELMGLGPDGLDELLGRAHAELDPLGLGLETFVAPFNRFTRAQYAQLARRYAIVTGGEESIRHMGWQRSPQWRGRAVYLPAYAPAYATAAVAARHVEELAEAGISATVPVALHWGWEASDDFASLRRAVRTLARHALPWQEFQSEVRMSSTGLADPAAAA